MPSLNWIGKDRVVGHHHDVPFKALEKRYEFCSANTPPQNSHIKSTENRIIYGDNLEALKALLPEFEGRIDCIYIDPPYNTGNENWVYNDAVNDPRIVRWLNKVVGKEGEDFSRHDKWLCMMYPRLKLLHRLLAEEGSIWVSIDDNAAGILRLLMDEIFGGANFVANVIWQKADSPRNSARQFSTDHDYILVYSKTPNWAPSRLPRTEAANAIYQNPDDDPRGAWIPGDPFANKPYSKGLYTISGPTGRQFAPPPGRYWRISEEKLRTLDGNGRIWWGPTGEARPSIKRYLAEVADLVPRTLWGKEEVGSNRTSKNELRSLFRQEASFDTPKPSTLLERVLDIATDENSIILDSFAGSGTTAHAVLKKNAHDNGNRRFILVEMMDYAESITAERVRRVMDGYGEGAKRVPGLGGGFAFYAVGQHALFDDDGHLNPAVDMDSMRRYLAYTEGLPAEAMVGCDNSINAAYVGSHDGRALLFHYQPHAGTTLDYDFLAGLNFDPATRPERLVVYADYCTLGEDFLARARIVFKKIPRDLTRL
ncbi:MAG: site-specific DNA-methyltransferase [Alphaproteobacteria bacterium]|nr:site-specific DNA-methyltransferase [Alphaproteobacteria bacterium]